MTIERLPLEFDTSDPIDAAIWKALEPMRKRRRAAPYIRSILAQALCGPTAAAAPVPLVPAEMLRGYSPAQVSLPSMTPIPLTDDDESIDLAVDNLLESFG